MDDDSPIDVVKLAAELTIAWLGNSNTHPGTDEVPAFFRSMFDTLSAIAARGTGASPAETETPAFSGAVSARRSLASPDHIISMIDGKPYRMLRRHLSAHGLTPEEYLIRYKLKPDYPMVAPGYSETRRAMAGKIGPGRKPETKVLAGATPARPATRGRPSAAAAKAAARAHLNGK